MPSSVTQLKKSPQPPHNFTNPPFRKDLQCGQSKSVSTSLISPSLSLTSQVKQYLFVCSPFSYYKPHLLKLLYNPHNCRDVVPEQAAVSLLAAQIGNSFCFEPLRNSASLYLPILVLLTAFRIIHAILSESFSIFRLQIIFICCLIFLFHFPCSTALPSRINLPSLRWSAISSIPTGKFFSNPTGTFR